MLNKNLNLSLKLNKINDFGDVPGRPFTPIEQTLKTPIDPPQLPSNGLPPHQDLQPLQQQQLQYFQQSVSSSQREANQFFFAPPPNRQAGAFYQNPEYNESDDILTDIDEPSNFCKRNYSISFTNHFDQLLLSTYSQILSLPTTTPFLGAIPPSGLVGKVANETMSSLIKLTNSPNPPLFDQQSIINRDYLKNQEHQPFFLQLIRRRLLDLCSALNSKLPDVTSVQVYSLAIRNSSISNLSLNEMNVTNFANGTGSSTSSGQSRSRSSSSSLNLRKQSLTRNNSNNWLHVGNMGNLKAPYSGHTHFNISTDSLQESVPQSLINRSAPTTNASQFQPPHPQFSSMMMDYQNNNNSSSPPSNMKPNTPPFSALQTPGVEIDDFNFGQRPRSSSRASLPQALNINTDIANIQGLNSLSIGNGGPSYNNSNTKSNLRLDSPFLSSVLPPEETFSAFPIAPPSYNNNNIASTNSSPLGGSPDSNGDRINTNGMYLLFSLSEKKRESLKMKRGIH